jgi:class 3 adenylate cyclase/ActR/RegA family two-component response regulator
MIEAHLLFKMAKSSTSETKLEMFCVFYVDMESSTYNTAYLCPEDYTVYYRVFYDTLSEIASKFGGRVIKHVGDALIIYFPATSDPTNRAAFKSTLDCAMAMLGAQRTINDAFHSENLPPLTYRISADYGRLEYLETGTSLAPDWIGPSMNMVAKMNHMASTGNIVLGGDLHQILSRFSFEEYLLELIGELNIGIRQKYPIYSVTVKRSNVGSVGIGIFSPNNMAPPSLIRLSRNGRAAALPNVVIVDDEHDVLLTFQKYLHGQPVNVEIFSDPIQLLGRLALVGPSYYDLAILDIRMPKMNGFQVYQILAGLKPNIKALFVSALDYAEEFLTTLRWINKEEDFMRKPISRENLICAVNRKINIIAPRSLVKDV